jgi:two-component sensor histidine kinase
MFPAQLAAFRGRLFRAPEPADAPLVFPNEGARNLLFGARKIAAAPNPAAAILAALEESEARIQHHATQLTEAHHRIANSLQLITSVLSLRAGSIKSDETRLMLQDVIARLVLVATVERHLCEPDSTGEIGFGPYLEQLCANLSDSLTAADGRIRIAATCSDGAIKPDEATSLGMAVTELVMNALKHAFPGGRPGCIHVDFAVSGGNWYLSVSDDGIGMPLARAGTGFGSKIVRALARDLKAAVTVRDNAPGTITLLTYAARPNGKPL